MDQYLNAIMTINVANESNDIIKSNKIHLEGKNSGRQINEWATRKHKRIGTNKLWNSSNWLHRNVFCDATEGSILHAVQMARIFPDSKTFVDMKLTKSVEEVKQVFDSSINKEEPGAIAEFVENNFCQVHKQ